MKKALTFIAFIVLLSSSLQAQKYSINKHNYNAHDYIKEPGTPNDPIISGLASYFVPGLGQIIAGETGRGLAFFSGTIVSAFVGSGSLLALGFTGSPEFIAPTIIGLGGTVFIQIWSVVDAIKVAKINNLYARDRFKNIGFQLELSPYVSPVSSISPAQSSVGMSLRLSF